MVNRQVTATKKYGLRRPRGERAGTSCFRAHGNETALNPTLMRAIDYWAGLPLVFLVTVVDRFRRLAGLVSSPAGRPRNILFIQLAEMGTMVVAYPSLRKARELYPDATLHFLCFTQVRPSVEILEIVPADNIITIDAHSVRSLVRGTLLFLWQARRRRIDTVINME